MGGHHKAEIPEVPDFRKYRIEDAPPLLETQRKLAKLGLRDPWLRNEVWKYQLEGTYVSPPKHFIRIMLRGFKGGVALAIIMTAVTKSLKRTVDDDHH